MTLGWKHLLTRLALVAFCGLSGTYALLAYIPFTYTAVIRFPMVSWVPAFVQIHALLALGLLALTTWRDRPRLRLEKLRALWHAGAAVLTLAMLWRRPMVDIRNDGSSYLLALGFFLAPTLLLALDLAPALGKAFPGKGSTSADEPRRLCLAAMGTALVMALLHPLLARIQHGPLPHLEGDLARLAWGWTLTGDLLLTLGVAALLMGLLAGLRLIRHRLAEPLGFLAALLGAGTWLFQEGAFTPLSFSGPLALLLGALLTLLSVAFLTTVALARAPEPGTSPLELLLSPLVRTLGGRPGRTAGVLLLLALGLGLALPKAAVFDWNFLFQKALLFLGTLATGACLYAALPPRPERVRWTWALIAFPPITLQLFLAFEVILSARAAESPMGRLSTLLDRMAGRDISVRVLREALAPPRPQMGIYRLLQRNSNLPREVRTDPIDIQHVADLKATPGEKPDIYIFVVDSLRRDYLGIYNPKVTFTPELDRFARESVALQNAFTWYGATGLSEPSIWTGARMLHKQYIQPFHPMNSLQKLLETQGYQGLVSMDSILDVVVKRGPWLQDLDPGVGTQDLKLGESLKKLQVQLTTRKDRRPLFVYSQAQDLHISVINREGQGTVEPGDYQGFHAPYASRLKRLDRAFGAFIAHLKATGRYDRSVVIFTADHGDSLGEEGRFGHAYTLFPEIMRIPMLIHLPTALRDTLKNDPRQPAFLPDLTPSLYYLLGHRALKNDPNLGRPLFTTDLAEQKPFQRRHYLLASSYGPVFGILEGDGRTLYITDGVHFEDHLYQLGEGGDAKRSLTADRKQHYDRLIADEIESLNRFYRFTPRP